MNITRTQFTNFGTTDISYGFRSYDDQEQTYSNLMEREELIVADEELLRNIIAQYADDTFTNLFDWALHHTHFIVIDDREYAIETTNMDDSWKLVEKV